MNLSHYWLRQRQMPPWHKNLKERKKNQRKLGEIPEESYQQLKGTKLSLFNLETFPSSSSIL